MRLSLKAVLSALALSVFAGSANAEIYTEYVKGTNLPLGTGTLTSSTSSLGLSINLAGIANAVITPVTTVPGSYLIIDKNLDASGTGTLYFNGGQLTLNNFVQNVSLGFLGSVVATGNNVGFTFSGGPISVTNNNYSITNAVPGSLTINTGSISLVGTVLGQAINTSLDFNTSPVVQAFSGLTAPIPGRADADGTGTDLDGAGLPHTGYNVLGGVPDPGLTGFSNIDTDGAETFINYNGFSIATTIISGTLTLPTTITITGSTTVSVPEVSSVALIGASVLGLGVIARRRRSA
ncbi:hypothetical protein K2Y11_06775 [bacterium]|nr:hypothetical protein [bacterium]